MIYQLFGMACVAIVLYLIYKARRSSGSSNSTSNDGIPSRMDSLNEVERMLRKSGIDFDSSKLHINPETTHIKTGKVVTTIKSIDNGVTTTVRTNTTTYGSGINDSDEYGSYDNGIDYELIERAKNDIELYIKCMNADDFREMKSRCTESVIKDISKKSKMRNSNGCKEHFELVKITSSDMSNRSSNSEFTSKGVEVYTEIRNYTTDSYSGRVINGSKEIVVNAVFNVVYIRKNDVQVDKDSRGNKICSQCGAPITGIGTNCEYCGAYLRSGDYRIYKLNMEYI